MIKGAFAATAAALVLLHAAPAAAGVLDFRMCDGYPSPSKKADGMTQGTWLYGLASRTEDVRRRQNSFGADEAESCGRALADPLLLPQFWLRRGHLLQARGMHLIEAGDLERAVLSFAESDAIGVAQNDLFFGESVGLGNRVLRALAYFRMGKRDAALAELDAVDKARPYAADIRRLTRAVRLDNLTDLKARRALLMASVPMDPNVLGQLFWIAMFCSDFDQAAALAPQVSFDVPVGRGDWQIEGANDRKYERIERRAEVAGAAPYALAATGKAEAAKAAMARAREDIEAVIVAPPPPKPGKKLKPAVVNDYERRKRHGATASDALDTWDAAISLMQRAPGMIFDAVGTAIRDAKLRDSPALLHILGRVKPESQSDIAMQRRVITNLEERRDRELDSIWKVSFADLVKMLPRPERLKMKPTYRPAGDGFFLSDATGFYVKREAHSPYINVRFGSDVASRAMVEELGMLAAAFQARKLGKDSFLIDSRMIIQRTVNVYSYYGGLQSSYPNGNETRLRVLPVNAAELPASLEHSRWRLVRVADVIPALNARYAPVPERRIEPRERRKR